MPYLESTINNLTNRERSALDQIIFMVSARIFFKIGKNLLTQPLISCRHQVWFSRSQEGKVVESGRKNKWRLEVMFLLRLLHSNWSFSCTSTWLDCSKMFWSSKENKWRHTFSFSDKKQHFCTISYFYCCMYKQLWHWVSFMKYVF